MQRKKITTLLMFTGGAVGGYLPLLWGGSAFSMSSILLSGVGAFFGIWLAFKITQ